MQHVMDMRGYLVDRPRSNWRSCAIDRRSENIDRAQLANLGSTRETRSVFEKNRFRIWGWGAGPEIQDTHTTLSACSPL
eukprot:1000267-Rhodomonas_salina.2